VETEGVAGTDSGVVRDVLEDTNYLSSTELLSAAKPGHVKTPRLYCDTSKSPLNPTLRPRLNANMR
jgi:hypothetical protein